MKYHQQMQHPLWQKKRLEVLELRAYTCQECSDTETQLHVHHPYYKPNSMIWDYTKEELQCLCEKCHKETHAIDESIRKRLALLTIEDKEYIDGYLLGKVSERVWRSDLGMIVDLRHSDFKRRGFIDSFPHFASNIFAMMKIDPRQDVFFISVFKEFEHVCIDRMAERGMI